MVTLMSPNKGELLYVASLIGVVIDHIKDYSSMSTHCCARTATSLLHPVLCTYNGKEQRIFSAHQLSGFYISGNEFFFGGREGEAILS